MMRVYLLVYATVDRGNILLELSLLVSNYLGHNFWIIVYRDFIIIFFSSIIAMWRAKLDM